MRRRLLVLGGAIFLAIGGTIGEEIMSSSDQLCAAQAKTSFAEDVMPIFVGHCFSCHQPGGQGNEKSGLDLSSYEGVMKGTKSGKMVIPGDPESSNLMWLSGLARGSGNPHAAGQEEAVDLRSRRHPGMDPRGRQEQLTGD